MMWKIVKTRTIGVYFLYDKNKEIIYIGKSTTCIRQRLNNHLFQDVSNTFINENEKEFFLDKRAESCFFSYSEISEKEFVGAVESVFLNRIETKYNRKIN